MPSVSEAGGADLAADQAASRLIHIKARSLARSYSAPIVTTVPLMNTAIAFDADLIRRYDRPGPRYTSYPTAPQFHGGFTEREYREMAALSNEDPIPKALSLYLHIPFCHSLCYYCACNKIITRHTEKAAIYLGYLKQDIALQGKLFDRDRQVTQLHLGGGTPTYLDESQLAELMHTLGEHFQLDHGRAREFSIEVDPRTVSAQDIATLGDLGFNRISLGIQDFDPAVMEAVNRVQTPEQVAELIHSARSNRFHSVSLDLIYGLPKQTLQSFDRTLDQVLALKPDRLSVYSYAHLPKLVKAQKLIRAEDLPSPEEKLGLLQLTIERLTRAGYVYIGMDHFALPEDELARAQRNGTLHRNFQGYSTQADADLVGLGNTSIGKVAHSYSQNVKTLGEYYRAIAAGRLPLLRGIVLSADDLLRREVITELMCQGRLDFADFDAKHPVRFRNYFAAELKALAPLAADGLLSLAPDAIELTPAGRLLLRNVCMVFDRYLQPAQNQFSRTV